MLKGIGWSDYLFVGGILIAIYYVAVMVLFYRKEISQLFNRSKKSVRTFDSHSE